MEISKYNHAKTSLQAIELEATKLGPSTCILKKLPWWFWCSSWSLKTPRILTYWICMMLLWCPGFEPVWRESFHEPGEVRSSTQKNAFFTSPRDKSRECRKEQPRFPSMAMNENPESGSLWTTKQLVRCSWGENRSSEHWRSNWFNH